MSNTEPKPRSARHGRHFAAFLLVSLLSVLLLRTTLNAVPAGISFNSITPIAGGNLLVARTAANNPLNPPTFQLKADVWLSNSTATNRSVTSVTISYPGSVLTSFTYTPMSFPTDLPATAFVMVANDTSRVPIYDGLGRDLPLPLPPNVRIQLYLDADPVPVQLDYGLAIRDNAVPNGAYFFPAKASDLAAGQYWAFGTRHTVDSGGGGGVLNPSGGTQRYAVDMDVVQWNDSAWSSIKPGTTGKSNDDYWGFGMPMYAMADGTIVRCYRGEVDHQPDSFENITFEFGFGNSIFIDHGGDISIYGHMKNDTIPLDLCPADGENTGLNIPISAGDLIGQMGNTGRSTNAHLHLQVEGLPSNDPVSGAPINFLNIRALADETSINNLGETPTLRPLNGMTLHRHSLILPNPCGLDDLIEAGFIEVARHGIPGDCYQDLFHQITSEAAYRPVFVDGYEIGGDLFFNATFRPAGPTSVARHGLTGTQYQDLFADLTERGFRLHQVDSYLDGAGVRYAAIFERRPGPPFAAFHGLTDADYGQQFATLANSGFVAVNVSTVELGGQLRWTGLFEQVPVNGWTTETVSAAAYQAMFDANVAAGRIPTYVHGFSTGAGPYLTGIFVDPIGGSTSAVHGLSALDYQIAWDANTGAGRFTRAVSGYDSGGVATFAAIWRNRPATSLTSTPAAVTNQTTATFGIAADNPFTTLECRLDGAAFSGCVSPRSVVGLTEGNHTFNARAVDRELIRDLSPASFTWLVDVTPPIADITTPANLTKTVHGVLKDDPVTMTRVVGWADVVAVVTDNLSGVASVLFKVNGVTVPAAAVVHAPNTDTWSFRFVPQLNGEQIYTIEVTATDGATNSSGDAIQVIGVKAGNP